MTIFQFPKTVKEVLIRSLEAIRGKIKLDLVTYVYILRSPCIGQKG